MRKGLIRCENSMMFKVHRIFASLTFGIAFLVGPAGLAFSQEANVLGLPPVPQPKGGSAAPASGGASKPPAVVAPSRDVLSGELGLQHSALNGTGRLIVTTRAAFATAGAKSSAMDAAKAVQRELVNSCGKQCKPEKMSAPKILPSGQLEFELVFRPLHQHLSQAQFLAALQSKPMNLTAAQLTPLPSVPQPTQTEAAGK